MPDGYAARQTPLELMYACNKFKFAAGGSLIEFTRLRDRAASTNCVSTCCRTTLMVDHWFYEQKAVLIFRGVGVLLEPATTPAGTLVAEMPPLSYAGTVYELSSDGRAQLAVDFPELTVVARNATAQQAAIRQAHIDKLRAPLPSSTTTGGGDGGKDDGDSGSGSAGTGAVAAAGEHPWESFQKAVRQRGDVVRVLHLEEGILQPPFGQANTARVRAGGAEGGASKLALQRRTWAAGLVIAVLALAFVKAGRHDDDQTNSVT